MICKILTAKTCYTVSVGKHAWVYVNAYTYMSEHEYANMGQHATFLDYRPRQRKMIELSGG